MRYVIFIVIYLALLLAHLPLTTTVDVDNVPITAYFCKAVDCPTILTTLLQQQKATCAFYDISDKNIRKTLQGHTVYTADGGFNELDRPGLMHHKFCVFNNTVLTGSWNPTLRGSYVNDNYILLVTHPLIAQAYLKEIRYLKGGRGPNPVHLKTPNQSIELIFCPQHHCEETILDEVRRAHDTVKILSFTFTSKPLIALLDKKMDEGIRVQAVQEKRQAHLSDFDETIAKSGQLRYDNNPATMHGKVWIIDNSTLILGSYNPTKAATTKNDENILIIRNNTNLVRSFQAEFKRVWLESG